MSKYVRETKAAGQISAYIVLNKRGENIANIHIFHGEACLVNVWNYGNNKSAEDYHFQYYRASGYGYNKETAALSGMVIDGIRLFDHCDTDKKSEDLLKRYNKAVDSGIWDKKEWDQKADKIGASFCNYCSERKAYTSLHYLSGLDRLSKLGYKVIRAI